LRNYCFAARLLVVSAVLLPTLLCAAAAWLDYRITLARAGEYVATTAHALAHQTEGTLQTADLVLLRTLDRINGMDWQTIGQSRAVHDFLAETVTHLPAVQSVFLVDPAGYNSASSRAFPMQAFDDRNREYYIEAKKGTDQPFVSAAFFGQMTGQPGFTVSRPRLTNGRFDGVVVVTFSPAAFQKFYEAIALDPGVAAALVRTDGSLLVRYPEIGSSRHLPADSPLLRAAAVADGGVYTNRAVLDGMFRMTGFRRIAGQPLVAAFAVTRSYYLGQWYWHLAWLAGFGVLTTAALLWTSVVALRQASNQESNLRRLLAESERRKEAETTVQHLQRMEALGRLSGGLAHDFNNLLTAVISALELATKRLHEPDRVRRLIGTAMQAAERGARLTAQMLAFSRNRDIAPQPLDINVIIRDSEALIQRTTEALIVVSFSLEQALWPAICDRVQLEVALLNLAGNARDAMPLGGKLVIMTRNVTVTADEVPGLSAGEFVQISVTDTGEGMSSDTQTRAFDPFFTTKGVGKGTGLGLSQVYGFAQQLGGTAAIKSAVGEGTTVTIWLPRAQTVPAIGELPQVADALPSAPLRILLVDDDGAVRALTEDMLTDLGHEVVAVESGPAALTRLSADTMFDLLLVDFAMPMMNGTEVAAEAVRLRPHLPVLFTTGYADTGVLQSWMQLGYRTLNKPFSAADLERAVRQTIRARSNVVPMARIRPT
jgi:signal transduction histidine kinase/ActR/RegA family two-component response regulator